MTNGRGIATRAPADHAEWHSPHNPWLTAVVATLATFMEVLDTSIANVALPHIAGNLGASVEDSTWVLTSYLVSNAIVLPISAYLSSLMGRKNFYMGCVALFTISSFLCGLAPSLMFLVAFRLLQGTGGGGLQPSTQAILVDTFPPHQRGMGMALYGMTVVVAPIIGPTLGGWITDNFSWRWIFFINIPVGLISMAATSRLIEDPPYLPRRHGPDRYRVDFVGLGFLTLGLGTLQMVLDLGERHDWFASDLISVGMVAAVACLLFVVVWELRHPDPIIDLRLLGERNFGMSTLMMLVFGTVLFGSTVLLPIFMQTLLGYPATTSGLAISPGGVVVMVLMPLIGWMVSRFDVRWMIAFGVVVISYSLHLMASFNLQVDFWTIAGARAVQGLGLAFIFVPVNTIAYAYVPRESRNNASSLISLSRNIGGSIGISYVSTRLARDTQVHQNVLVGHLTPYDPTYREAIAAATAQLTQHGDVAHAALRGQGLVYRAMEAQARTMAFVDEFAMLAVAFLLMIPIVLIMRRPPATSRPEVAH